MAFGAATSDWLPTRDLPSWPGQSARLKGRRYDCSRPHAVDDLGKQDKTIPPLAQTGGGVQIRLLGGPTVMLGGPTVKGGDTVDAKPPILPPRRTPTEVARKQFGPVVALDKERVPMGQGEDP